MEIQPLLPGASREQAHRVAIGGCGIGGAQVAVIAGPCAVEPEYVAHARAAAAAGASVLRGSIWKPRTDPQAFQGLGDAGLELIDAAREATGLPVLVEPLELQHVRRLRGHADALLIGTRSMHNTPLLRAAGASGLPVVLKRGMSATYDEWLAAARYILCEGNEQVILCERGIRTFETATRNTLDIAAIPVLRERTNLPVIVDPSHAAGRARWVPSLATAAVAAGADGLLVEAHPHPEMSMCDAAQAITPHTLRQIVEAAEALAAMGRPWLPHSVDAGRAAIDSVDSTLAMVVERRASLVAAVEIIKQQQGIPVRDRDREGVVLRRFAESLPRLANADAVRVMRAVIDACVRGAELQMDGLTEQSA